MFDYDISPLEVNIINEALDRYRPERPLLLASELGYSILKTALEENKGLEIFPVINNFFGGNIGCAGLLVLEDFYQAYVNYRKNNSQPDLLILPSIAFDPWERDLTGRGVWELEERVGIKCVSV